MLGLIKGIVSADKSSLKVVILTIKQRFNHLGNSDHSHAYYNCSRIVLLTFLHTSIQFGMGFSTGTLEDKVQRSSKYCEIQEWARFKGSFQVKNCFKDGVGGGGDTFFDKSTYTHCIYTKQERKLIN